MDEFELDKGIADAIGEWLAEGLDDVGWLPLDELRDAVDSEPVVPIIEVLPHFNRAMLLNPDGCGWRLLVP